MTPLEGITLRRATTADAEAAAQTLISARRAAAPAVPPAVHTATEIAEWFCGHVMNTMIVWVACQQSSIVGVMACTDEWIEQLYVEPDFAGRGIGSALVKKAKIGSSGALQLWTFVSNAGAQRFYERHGFVDIQRTDGDNEEGEPDIRYRWSDESQDPLQRPDR